MDDIFKAAVVGSGGVGKTAILSRYRSQEFVHEYNPTIGDRGDRSDRYTTDVPIDYRRCPMEIVDYTPGVPINDPYAEEIAGTMGIVDCMTREIWRARSEALILVYSVASKSSLTEIEDLCQGFQQKHREAYDLIPKVMAGNKVDTSKRAVSRREGEEAAQRLGCTHIEVSAKDGTNIEELFDIVAALIRLSRMEKWFLGDLKGSLPQWNKLFKNLKGKTHPVPNMINLTLVDTSAGTMEESITAKPQRLQAPRRIQRHKSLPAMKSIISRFRTRSTIASSETRALSTDCGTGERCYSPDVAKAFADVKAFLCSFIEKIQHIQHQRLLTSYQIAIAIENATPRHAKLERPASLSSVFNSEERITATFWLDLVEEVSDICTKCTCQCGEAFKAVVRHKGGEEKIKAIDDKFTMMVETVASRL